MNEADYMTLMAKMNANAVIDTSSLMEPAFGQFAETAETIFVAEGRRISIPPVVILELYRLIGSPDQEKAARAERAIHTVRLHPDLFEAPWCDADDTAEATAFADVDLLTDLMKKRRDGSQLLITNDRALSADAFDLNELRCSRGARVNVCYIGRNGDLRMCGCVKEALNVGNPSPVEQADESPCQVEDDAHSGIVNGAVAEEHQPEPTAPNSGSKENGTLYTVLGLGVGFSAGVIITKYGRAILRAARTAITMI